MDTNGDGIVSPLDALLVFNYLSGRQIHQAEAPASSLQHPTARVGEPPRADDMPAHQADLSGRVCGPLPLSALELDILAVTDDLLHLLAADLAGI